MHQLILIKKPFARSHFELWSSYPHYESNIHLRKQHQGYLPNLWTSDVGKREWGHYVTMFNKETEYQRNILDALTIVVEFQASSRLTEIVLCYNCNLNLCFIQYIITDLIQLQKSTEFNYQHNHEQYHIQLLKIERTL